MSDEGGLGVWLAGAAAIAKCWEIGDEKACGNVSDCYWDFRYPCKAASCSCLPASRAAISLSLTHA